MSTWTSVGHAMRRRMGAPSNHLESAGATMSRNMPTPEEVIASSEHSKSPRRYVGQDAYNFTNVSADRGNTIPEARHNTQAGDPTIADKANRAQVLAGNAAQSERMGARYEIGATFPAVHSIEASATMINAKIIPSVAGRQNPNFRDEMGRSY